MNKFSILTIALICGLSISACTASEKVTSDKGSAGGTEQVKSFNTDDKQAENKSVETKKIAEKEVLYDFRKSDNSNPQTFSKAETDAVVKYLFGDQASPNLKITSRLSGSFTKQNAKETLYYISGCKDETTGKFTGDCPHSVWDSAAWIAIYDGTTPVLKIEKALGSNLGKVTDLDGDGKNEFLSFGGYGQSGIFTEGLAIGQVSDGIYQNIKGFSGYATNCEFGVTTKKLSAKALVISYVPTKDGKMPEFTEEYFEGTCRKGSGNIKDSVDQSSWKTITKKEFEEFFDSLS